MKTETLISCCGCLICLAFLIPVGYAAGTAAPATFPAKPATGYVTDCEIVRVIDGDTVVVEMKTTLNIRLLDCWAPESRTTNAAEKIKGLAAKKHLQDLITTQPQATLFVPLTGDLTDAITLGRALGYIWRKGNTVTLNQQQVDARHATLTKTP